MNSENTRQSNGKLLFKAGKYNRQLWISDGTTNGTYKILPDSLSKWNALGNGANPVLLNNEVYFSANYDDSIGIELYKLWIDTTFTIINQNYTVDVRPFVYPNPFSKDLNIILLEDKMNSAEITFIDIRGRIVKYSKQNHKIAIHNTSDIEAGVYILIVEHPNKRWASKITKYE